MRMLHRSMVTLRTQPFARAPVDASKMEQYSLALFMALSHMLCIGYGRYPPNTMAEIWITIFSMVIGASLYASFIGQISSLTLTCVLSGERISW